MKYRPKQVVTYLPIDAIAPDPRKYSRTLVKDIACSISAFGFSTPILLDSQNRVVAGHGRLEAAKLLKMSMVPVVRLERLRKRQTEERRSLPPGKR